MSDQGRSADPAPEDPLAPPIQRAAGSPRHGLWARCTSQLGALCDDHAGGPWLPTIQVHPGSSAIVLAAAGVFLMATDTTTATTGINHILAFELPPSFFELMFVFGILLQIFFATTLVTFGAVLALAVIHYSGTLIAGRASVVQCIPHQRVPRAEPPGHGPIDLAQIVCRFQINLGHGNLVLLRWATPTRTSALLR